MKHNKSLQVPSNHSFQKLRLILTAGQSLASTIGQYNQTLIEIQIYV